MQSPRPLTLLIVDKESSGRSAFAQLCRRANDLHVAGEAGSGGATLDAVETLSPDVMLIDVRLLVHLLDAGSEAHAWSIPTLLSYLFRLSRPWRSCSGWFGGWRNKSGKIGAAATPSLALKARSCRPAVEPADASSPPARWIAAMSGLLSQIVHRRGRF